MTFVITQPCIGTKSADCVEVCPVNCIHDGGEQFYIDPVECIDCGACVSTCPVEAIFAQADVPAQWASFTAKNAELTKAGPKTTPPAAADGGPASTPPAEAQETAPTAASPAEPLPEPPVARPPSPSPSPGATAAGKTEGPKAGAPSAVPLSTAVDAARATAAVNGSGGPGSDPSTWDPGAVLSEDRAAMTKNVAAPRPKGAPSAPSAVPGPSNGARGSDSSVQALEAAANGLQAASMAFSAAANQLKALQPNLGSKAAPEGKPKMAVAQKDAG